MKKMVYKITVIAFCRFLFYTKAQLFSVVKDATISSSSTTLSQETVRSRTECGNMCSCHIHPNCCAATYRDQDKSCTLNTDCQRETTAMSESEVLTKYPGSCNYIWKDCEEVSNFGGQNGVFQIHPLTSLFVDVYCKIDADAWIVIQRRIDGSVSFLKTWDEYKSGFGYKDGEYWLGNEIVHQITMSGGNYELRIDMVKTDNQEVYVQYSTFSLGDEASGYKLNIAEHSGTAGDSLAYHNGQAFSTIDRDNDKDTTESCAAVRGAWWHNACSDCALNDDFAVRQEWDNVLGSVVTSVMMIRKV